MTVTEQVSDPRAVTSPTGVVRLGGDPEQPHGTSRKWVLDHCRCVPCKVARDVEKNRTSLFRPTPAPKPPPRQPVSWWPAKLVVPAVGLSHVSEMWWWAESDLIRTTLRPLDGRGGDQIHLDTRSVRRAWLLARIDGKRTDLHAAVGELDRHASGWFTACTTGEHRLTLVSAAKPSRRTVCGWMGLLRIPDDAYWSQHNLADLARLQLEGWPG